MLPARRRNRRPRPASRASLHSLRSFILRFINGHLSALSTTRYINADFTTLAVQLRSGASIWSSFSYNDGMQGTEFTYDTMSRRVTTTSVTDALSQVTYTGYSYDDYGRMTANWGTPCLVAYNYDVGRMIATRGTACKVAYDYDDGRVIALATRYINADFETLADQLKPCGSITSTRSSFISSGTMTTEFVFRFSTKHTDNETGLVYYGYRLYNPELGRWINRDPIGEEDGVNVYLFIVNGTQNAYDYLGIVHTCSISRESNIVFRPPVFPESESWKWHDQMIETPFGMGRARIDPVWTENLSCEEIGPCGAHLEGEFSVSFSIDMVRAGTPHPDSRARRTNDGVDQSELHERFHYERYITLLYEPFKERLQSLGPWRSHDLVQPNAPARMVRRTTAMLKCREELRIWKAAFTQMKNTVAKSEGQHGGYVHDGINIPVKGFFEQDEAYQAWKDWYETNHSVDW